MNAKTQIFAIFRWKKQIIIKKKLPHEIIGENLHCINSANSSSTTEVTLVDIVQLSYCIKLSRSKVQMCLVGRPYQWINGFWKSNSLDICQVFNDTSNVVALVFTRPTNFLFRSLVLHYPSH